MCKKRIEKAGSENGTSSVSWNKQSKIATIIFDSSATSEKEILKLIAVAGHDNEMFTADSAAYESLHECCKYDREQ